MESVYLHNASGATLKPKSLLNRLALQVMSFFFLIFCCNSSKSFLGNLNPYIAETCTEGGYNHTDLLKCRRQHEAAAWLVAVTIVVLVVIAILVVATYVVDYKKGKASSGGYEPIGGI